VDRYIPGYVFFGDGISQGYVGGKPTGDRSTPGGTVPQSESESPRWIGKSIRLVIDEQREIVETEHF
jgi:D-glycerate 3-kinase